MFSRIILNYCVVNNRLMSYYSCSYFEPIFSGRNALVNYKKTYNQPNNISPKGACSWSFVIPIRYSNQNIKFVIYMHVYIYTYIHTYMYIQKAYIVINDLPVV